MKKTTSKKSTKRMTQSELAELQPPKIEFPCADYPIKVIGHNSADFTEYVLAVMAKYDSQFDVTKVTHQDSKTGKFRSVRMFMTAQSEQQLIELNAEFKASGKVVTVI